MFTAHVYAPLLQVVNGVKYSLTLLVGRSSTCRNDGVPATLEQCPAKLDTVCLNFSSYYFAELFHRIIVTDHRCMHRSNLDLFLSEQMEKWEAEVWQHSTSSQYDILALDKVRVLGQPKARV